jgi:hypothetical protein
VLSQSCCSLLPASRNSGCRPAASRIPSDGVADRQRASVADPSARVAKVPPGQRRQTSWIVTPEISTSSWMSQRTVLRYDRPRLHDHGDSRTGAGQDQAVRNIQIPDAAWSSRLPPIVKT